MVKLKKIGAFTLFESVIAITIITVLVGIGTATYSNVVQSEKPLAYYQAKAEIDLLYQELIGSQLFVNRNLSYETFEIDQEVIPYRGNKYLFQVNWTVNSGGKEWWKEQHLIVNSRQ